MNRLFLREERQRLGLQANEVARHTGVAIPTQSNYETGKRYPDAGYLIKLDELGFDINYVITGKRRGDLSSEERELISLYRKSTDSVKSYILSGLKGL